MKLINFLLKLVGLVVLICVVIAFILIYMLYDGNNALSKEYQGFDGTIEEQTNDLIVKALDNTANDGYISITFNESELNYFLASLSNSLKEKLSGTGIDVKGIELTLNDDGSIELYSYFEFMTFKSSLKGSVTIVEEGDDFTLTLNNINVSKLSFDSKMVGSILSKYISETEITQKLTEAGINVDLDLKTLSIKFNVDEVMETFTSKLEEKDSILYVALIDLAISEDILEFDFNKDKKLGIRINLEKLAYDEENHGVIPTDYTNSYSEVKEDFESLIADNLLTYENASKGFYYLVNGYNKIADEEGFEFIDELDLSSIGITDNKEYAGIKNPSVSLISVINDQTPTVESLEHGLINFKLSEENLNNILMNIDAVETTYAFYSSDKSIFSYVYMEGIFVDILEDAMTLTCVININGYKIALELDVTEASDNGIGITTHIDDIYVGELLVDDQLENQLLAFLEVALANEMWININSQNETLSITLDSYFEMSSFYSLISGFINTETSFDYIGDKGYININMSID